MKIMHNKPLRKTFVFLGIPFFTFEYKINYKLQFKILGISLFSIPRKPISKQKARNCFELDNKRNFRNIFVNIGYLAFKDEISGIPRVAMEIVRNASSVKSCSIVPFYFDPVSGSMIEYSLKDESKSRESPKKVCRVMPGDVILNTIPNSRELEFNKETILLLKSYGIIIGDILHDIIALEYPEYFKKKDVESFKEWIEIISNHDFVLSVSETTLKAYVSWARKNKLRLPKYRDFFWLGANFKYNNIEYCDAEIRMLLGSNYALMVATIEPRKGHEAVLKAFECLWEAGSHLKLVLVGKEGWKVKELIDRISKNKWKNERLFWFSDVHDEKLAFLYKNSSFCIIASLAEGFGLPVVEANYFGKWVLCRDIPVFREIATNHVVFFHEDNPFNLAESILKIEKISKMDRSDNEKGWQDWKASVEQICDRILRIKLN